MTDYLLKPYTFERWVQAVDRARENLAAKSLTGTVPTGPGSVTPPERKFIFIRTEYGPEKLVLDDLALGKIDAVEKESLRVCQTTIPVSDTYRGAFLRAIGLSNGRGH